MSDNVKGIDVNFNQLSRVKRITGDAIDRELQRTSEEKYISIVERIIDITKNQLENQENNKDKMRKFFLKTMPKLLCIQLIFLLFLILFKGFLTCFYISDGLIIAFISSVFLETLGVVAVMIKFAFDSKPEGVIVEILNGVVENFQKFTKNSKEENG